MRKTKAKASIALAALLLFALSSNAQAAYDPLGSGAAKLTLDKGFAAFLKQNSIKLSPSQGAKRKGSTYTLPVVSGNLDPTLGKGEIDTEGILTFSGARKKVPLKRIRLKTNHSPLIAKVAGSQLKAATSAKLSFGRKGFDSTFSAKALKLTAKLVTRLNKKLRPKAPFWAGQTLGRIESQAEPKTTTVLEANRSTLTFDPAFLAKLSARFVSLNPIFPAEHSGPTFSFPIAIGGAIAPDGSEGTLRTGGTVELLQLGGGQVFWQEPWLELGAASQSAEVDLEPSPAFPGKIGRVGVFAAAPGQVSSDPGARTVSDAGVALTLTAETAKALNDAFAEGQPLFGAGEVAGSLSFVAQGQ
jgi:hypothetical protein